MFYKIDIEGTEYPIVQRNLNINDIDLKIYDFCSSNSSFGTEITILKNEYGFEDIKFDKGDVFIDLGANTGLLSFYVSKKFPFIQVNSYECNKLLLKLLNFSIVDNLSTNINLHSFGIGSETKTKSFNIEFSNSGGSSFFKQESENNMKVNTLMVEFETAMSCYDKIKYLKMDIEGSEFSIFRKLIDSSSNFFERVEHFCLEFHNINNDYESNKEEITEYLNSFKNLNIIYQ